MKKNRLMRIAALMLVLTLATSCFVGGTFAKYTSTATVDDVAKVAKWSVKLGTEQIASTTSTDVEIDLFTTISDVDGSGDDAQVKDGKLIAPGTSGSFALSLTNESEVDAKYTMSLAAAETGGDIPIEYTLTPTVADSWKSDITELNTADSLKDEALAMGATDQATAVVYWRWVFNGDDAADTALGVAAQTTAPSVTVTATIVIEQVD